MTRLRLLGGVGLGEPGPAGPLAPDLPLWLCALLALRASPLAREQAAALLWPEAEPASAQNRLRQLLHRTRRSALGAGMHAESGRLAWLGGSDVADFRAAAAAQRWEEAADHYGGPLLDGLPLPESEELRELFTRERAHLHDRYLDALERAAAAFLAQGRLPEAAARLSELLAADPLQESAVSALMRCLEAQGSAGRARTVYETYRRDLAAALGVAPSAALQAQAGRLRPERPVSRPGLRGAPQPLTSFVGRERELALVQGRLTGPARWLTLSGPGGSGKTRLALEAATELAAHFAGGAHFVPLAASDPGRLVAAVLAALGVAPQAGPTPEEQLLEALAGPERLLVLDNFEHLQAEAALLPGWLRAAPGLRLLVTSRHRLNFQDEWALRLNGLDTALPGEDPLTSPAGLLFVERASRADARFEPQAQRPEIERVCRRCEGLPLALELAAAWVGELDMPALALALEADMSAFPSRLHDQEGRHRSLSVVFGHAWRLLPPGLATCYAALAVLRAPFGEIAARAVAGATPGDLRELERRSLLQDAGHGLYSWHQNLREAAWTQLDPAAKAAAGGRHLAHLLSLAEAAAPQLHGPEQAQALAAHAALHDDLRAALAYARRQGRWAEGLQLAGALHWYWYVRGHHAEGLSWLDTFLALFEDAPPTPALARALVAGSALASERGRLEQAEARARRALAAYRALADGAGEAGALHQLGLLAREQEREPEARAHLEAALTLREAQGQPGPLGTVLNDLGILEARGGARELARAYFRRSLALKEQSGDRQGVAYALGNLGAVASDLHEELALYQQSLVIKRELGDVQGLANTTFNCALVATELHDLAQARAYHEEALELFVRLGKHTQLGAVLAEIARWLTLAGTPLGALTLVEAALGLEGHGGRPLPAHTAAKLRALHDELSHRPGAERARTDGRGLGPEAALHTALAALRHTPLGSLRNS